MSPTQITTRDFLSALWGDQQGFAELAFRRPSKENPEKTDAFWGVPFEYPAHLDDLITELEKNKGSLDCYYGVCLRKETWERGSRGKNESALSATCLWVDIDFKDSSRDQVLQAIRDFPRRPSIGVFSGGGWHVFWMLREPATGAELQKIPAINSALIKRLRGDPAARDLARVMRMPNTPNLKYSPPQLAVVEVWRPDLRYNLSDFDDLLGDADPKTTTVGHDVAIPGAVAAVDIEKQNLSDPTKAVIRDGLSAYYTFREQTDKPEEFEKRKHENRLTRSDADAWLVVQLIQAGITTEQIFSLFRDPRYKCGDKYRDRGTGGDSYLAHTVKSSKIWCDKHPNMTADAAAARVAGKVKKEFDGTEAIEVVKIFKIPLNPQPEYRVVCRLPATGVEKEIECNLEELCSYRKFRNVFFSVHNFFLPLMKAARWEELLSSHHDKIEVMPLEDDVAGPAGEVRAAVREFLQQAKPTKTSVAMTQLDYLPVIEEISGNVCFKLTALLAYIKSQRIDAQRRTVIVTMKQMKYIQTVKRFGTSMARVWVSNSPSDTDATVTKTEL